MFQLESDSAPGTRQDTSDSMSLLDKMSLWGRKSGSNEPTVQVCECFDGVKEEEDEDISISQLELSTYSKTIVSSTAYDWLIDNLLKESSFHWDEALPRIMVDAIRQRILDELPIYMVSKRQDPTTYKVTFHFPRGPLERRLKQENDVGQTAERRLSDIIVLTCSSVDEIQAATVAEYLDQTWTSGGSELLKVLNEAIKDPLGRCVACKVPTPFRGKILLTIRQQVYRARQSSIPSLIALS